MHKQFLIAVKNILTPLVSVDDSQPLSEVNAYSKSELENFPCVNIDYEEPGEIERLDSDHNQRNITLTVRLIFPMKKGETALHARLDVLDDVLNEFDKRDNIDTLNGIMEIWEVLDILRFDVDEPEQYTGYEFKIRGRQGVQFT